MDQLPAPSHVPMLPNVKKYFRPQLELCEVLFILESIAKDKDVLEKKLEYLKRLDYEVYDLRKLVMVDPGEALRHGLKDKKIELEKLQKQQYAIWQTIQVQTGLIERFTDLASGVKRHGGRPKRLFTYAKGVLNETVR